VQPRGVRERGLGQSRPPGCEGRSGRDHYPHTRPPACDYPREPDQTQLRPPWPLGMVDRCRWPQRHRQPPRYPVGW